MLAILLPGATSFGFKPAPVLPMRSFVAQYCFLSLIKTECKTKSFKLAGHLHVGDVVVNCLCILVRVGCKVSSNSCIVIDREDTLHNL